MNKFTQNLSSLFLLMLLATSSFSQQGFPRYYQQAEFGFSSPGAFDDVMLGYINPATLGMLRSSESRFYYSADAERRESSRHWGLFTGVNHVGFGWIRQNDANEYRFSFGGGSDAFSAGAGYGWSGNSSLMTVGTLMRPSRFLSIGMSGFFALKRSDREGILDLALRPLGTDRLTLFSDFSIRTKERMKDAPWSGGAVLRVLPGIHLTARYFDTKAWTAGLSFSLGTVGISAQTKMSEDNDIHRIQYGIRIGGRTDNILDRLWMKNTKYYSQELKGDVRYQKFKLFDDATHTLLQLLNDLQSAIDDPTVSGVALNLSGMTATPEMVWELREKLLTVRGAGKRVIVYLDRAGMTEYHLASVADRIVMDPEGLLLLEGYVMGRTFQKEMLEKLGLGFDEWRFFKYKSAAESLSRDGMSEADREQRQAILDDVYETVRGDICASRNMETSQFDELINEKVIFDGNSAVESGLADTLGRWIDMKKIIESVEGGKKRLVSSGDSYPSRTEWGERPHIALVYGTGVCDLDEGIKARQLEKVFEKLTEDHSIQAVVFRVDSPGGDGLASDLVAEAMKKCAAKKPVIVSQGGVAASGGYWLSMYADSIVAAPFTITGSIGVIGGWLWNKGLGDKLGLKSDHVKVGRHADLGFGIQLPLLGIQIPDRHLTPDERSSIEKLIRHSYDGFVAKVSQGRGIPADSVANIAQGRVWTGMDARGIGLVDEIGGLETAITLARRAADIPEREEIAILEFPKPGLFDVGIFFPKLFGYELRQPFKGYEWEFMQKVSQHPGEPLPMLSPESMLE